MLASFNVGARLWVVEVVVVVELVVVTVVVPCKDGKHMKSLFSIPVEYNMIHGLFERG